MTHGEDEKSEIYEPVPRAALRLYRLTWQLETWLRLLVYVELRSARLDWEEPIKRRVREWPPSSFGNDKRLHHMTTSHQASVSYLTFGQLWAVISDNDNWPLFEPYFPPKAITDARIEEIKAIRNRVAHFREPHPQDEARLELFLRDLEPGIRQFCIRYTRATSLSQSSNDPVTGRLAASWERVGYGIELRSPKGEWLYAPGSYRMRPLMNADLHVVAHEKQTPGATVGLIYRLHLISPTALDREFNVTEFLQSTEKLHKYIIHIIVPPLIREMFVTIPAIHETDTVAELISGFLSAGRDSVRGSRRQDLERARLEWPEYVLWPNNLLSLFTEEIDAPILDLA
ncbi:hypothetical protein WMF45_43155 [Sorangium sp. So ce448]|uniref:hypothetical protein n=1 Tax=Sorangium sp. So ce448 TaxID=3133314 RepID=UPI003F5D5A6F